MSTSLHLNIPEPCQEDWQKMTPNEQGRHCGSCQKTVVDFTLMSDQEILNYISNASSGVCGRFNNDQLNKTYTEKKIKPSFTFRYAWNMIVAALLLTSGAAIGQSRKALQGKVTVKKQEVKLPDPREMTLGTVVPRQEIAIPVVKEPAPVKPATRKITGVVIDDSTGNPVSFATVCIEGQEKGIAADEQGRFSLPVPAKKEKVNLVVSGVGYEDNEFEVVTGEKKTYRVMMSPAPDQLQPVTIVAYPKISCGWRNNPPINKQPVDSSISVLAGGLVVTQRITITEMIKREVKDWLPLKKEVQVYPNPVAPGSMLNVSMQLKKTGGYKLELMDAGGRLVHVQAIQVAQPAQLISLATQSSWSRGIYWMRISTAADKNVYQAKVLLQ